MSSASAVNCPVASMDSTTGIVSGDVHAWDYRDFRDNMFKVDASFGMGSGRRCAPGAWHHLPRADARREHFRRWSLRSSCRVWHSDCIGWPDEGGCAGSRTTRLGLFHSKFARQGAKQEHVQALQTSFWTDLALVYLERTASDQTRIQDEPQFFWDSLTRSSKKVAEDAKQHCDRQLVMRGEAVALKISVLERSRMFFRLELELQVIRQLDVRFGYIPAGMDVLLLSLEDLERFYAVNHGCYDFLNTAYNDDGYVFFVLAFAREGPLSQTIR
jgi:hypothetical protein